ncbi:MULTISPECIES: DUF2442 domain-containing protein [unclassified Pseudoalteromonas]|uniref:DUF2442 domain-containing protein n=1 Tax=unclassified Pseudoalteromonas TaxID=194690 RepID=UPI00110A5D7F|nr:DUF2442 domain-containing protein [Pseudoalteromonas sp. S558]TMN98375.1 DUF2442 domain-containing protein [Pseudoalteromonas sp. S558]
MTSLDSMTITSFEIVSDYTIKITFADNKVQTIDFEPVIGFGWMENLKNIDYFKLVSLNDGGNLEWPEGQDFNPEALYDWEKFQQIYIDDINNQKG